MSLFHRTPRAIACKELVERVTDYLEDALPARERRIIDRHLAACDGCSAYVEQMRETRRLTGALQPEDVPAAGVDALLAAFRAQHGKDA
jgi:anti-sigma factor RsiW